jgi:hypothetical protein
MPGRIKRPELIIAPDAIENTCTSVRFFGSRLVESGA